MADTVCEMIERGASVDWFRVEAYACNLEYQASMHLAQGRVTEYRKAEQEMLQLSVILEGR